MMNLFYSFLCRKYHIEKKDLKNNTIFDLVKNREDDSELLDLYGEIWNSIESLYRANLQGILHIVYLVCDRSI
jgi:hypothetical protein